MPTTSGATTVPATERRFSASPPSSLYVDADVLINYVIDSEPHHGRTRSFFRDLEARGGTTLYVSSLTWLEIAHAITREGFRRRLESDVQRRFRLDQWRNEQVRETYVQTFLGWLEGLLNQFEWNEVFVTDQIRVASVPIMTRHRLSSQDACHVACAWQEGVQDLASFDEAFRRVDGLILWNDVIHGSR